MKTFAINTLGCKVNQYESQQVRELLERLGLHQVNTAGKPDLVLVNTCCVTHTASAKSRQYISKARKLNPRANIVVSGCLPAVQIGELNKSGRNLHLVSNQDKLAATLRHIVETDVAASTSQALHPFSDSIRTKSGTKIKGKNSSKYKLELAPLTSFKGQTRAFLKIQDGCDGRCSYCIIPRTRPHVSSKPPEMVLGEAQALVQAGHKEIVLTGIFLGAYGQSSVRRKNWQEPENGKLPYLLKKVAQIPGLARIRLSSLEPSDVTPPLLDVFCEHRNIMPHLHLSLQSGSTRILQKMCRQYTTEQFHAAVEQIRSRFDRPALTADVIVGFPGETDADFDQTVQVSKQVGFAKMHVFSFSPRKGTAAAKMQGRLDYSLVKARSRILRHLDAEMGRNYRQQFIGQTASVLLENTNGTICGRSERYFMVHLKKTQKKLEKNRLVWVELVENAENGAIGKVIDESLPENAS
ncbi:MAG: tRNA (N(6)-L-threonylcarbamoyladenosine(37)-C(2))-methylthiotransferase MtaB [Planctomycetota bacterium]|jgi:threonylcarbamoyladenosine tRNA methylthiotransferase MtaB